MINSINKMLIINIFKIFNILLIKFIIIMIPSLDLIILISSSDNYEFIDYFLF